MTFTLRICMPIRNSPSSFMVSTTCKIPKRTQIPNGTPRCLRVSVTFAIATRVKHTIYIQRQVLTKPLMKPQNAYGHKPKIFFI